MADDHLAGNPGDKSEAGSPAGPGRPRVSADQLAQFRATMAEAMAELQQTTEELRAQSATFLAEVEQERQRLRADRERAEAEYAEQARDGQAGDARRELQERIDNDETTWREVISGADDHWSAREVRAELVTDARSEIDAIEESDPDLAQRYRAHARLRDGDPNGEWHD
jgi:hypothetical protein